jgi:hypothetical protein
MSPAPLVPGNIPISTIARIITRASFKIQFPGPRKKQEQESRNYWIFRKIFNMPA